MKFNTAYSTVPEYEHKGLSIDKKEGLTEQSHKQECDINKILERYEKDKLLTHRNEYKGFYGMATPVEYQEAMNIFINAQKMFNDLPSAARNKFGNDVSAFLGFVQEPSNAEEMVKLGLATEPKDIAPLTVQIDASQMESIVQSRRNPAEEAPPPA
jgi:phage internal scaffolding protein